jgi:hypothetical protein
VIIWLLDDAQQARMAQFAVIGPFDEANLHDDLGPHPVRAQTRQTDGFRKRRFGDFELV